MSFVIRCGTPDCDWGKEMAAYMPTNYLRYAEFLTHCIRGTVSGAGQRTCISTPKTRIRVIQVSETLY